MQKSKRQAIIRRIIMENTIDNQQQLLNRLKEEGIEATQSTISRDIRELNIIKQQDSRGNVHYQLLNNSVLGINKRTDEERLIQTIIDTGVSLTQVEFANILIVLPGNGQVVGVLVDSIRLTNPDIIGCIAGDDTILLLSKDKNSAGRVNRYIGQYLCPN